jgi:hypothetical protein
VGARVRRWADSYRRCGHKVRLGWWLLAFSVVNWPVAALVCAWQAEWRFEPFEQLIVFYSLLALAFTAVTAILAADNGSG